MILSVRVDDTLSEAVRQLAEADSRPISNYVELLLKKHVAEKGIDLGKIAVRPRPKRKGRKP